MKGNSISGTDNGSTVADDMRTAALAFFPDAAEIAPLPDHPDLARVATPAGVWRVRRWPPGTPENDVWFCHDAMTLAHNAGLTVVPELATPPGEDEPGVLPLAGRLFDAQRWLPGAPPPRAEVGWPDAGTRIDLPVAMPVDIFSDVALAMARFHNATHALASTVGIPSAPLAMLPGAVRQAHGRHLAALRAKARREPAIQRWLATGERLMASAEPLITASDERERSSAVLHLGLWPAHVLLDGDTLSGLLGWERVAAGSPLLDLAQAILRLQGWTEEAVETALGAYGEVRDLAPAERRLLPAVAALDAVATTGRLLEQTFAVEETARPSPALRGGIEMMLRSMTALDRALNAPSEKSRRRTWNRQRPQPGRRNVS